MIPWILIFTFFISFFIAMRRRSLRKLVSTDDLRTLAANDDGLIWTEPAMKAEYRWHAFHGYSETPNLFVLYQGDARRAPRVRILVVPKRAFPSSAMLLEFTDLLQTHARGHGGAFPVIPIKPADKLSMHEPETGEIDDTGKR